MVRNEFPQAPSLEEVPIAQEKKGMESQLEKFDVVNRQDIVRALNVLQGFGEKELEAARRRQEKAGVDYRHGWLDEITDLRAFMGTGVPHKPEILEEVRERIQRIDESFTPEEQIALPAIDGRKRVLEVVKTALEQGIFEYRAENEHEDEGGVFTEPQSPPNA